LAGRANAALNVIHIGGAFALQELIGIVIERWPVDAGFQCEVPSWPKKAQFAMVLLDPSGAACIRGGL
jgi:hypothetical protein